MNKTWVWVTGLCLLLLMLPVWPVTGGWLGLPLWVWLAVGASVLMSGFVAFVSLVLWNDPEDPAEGGTDD